MTGPWAFPSAHLGQFAGFGNPACESGFHPGFFGIPGRGAKGSGRVFRSKRHLKIGCHRIRSAIDPVYEERVTLWPGSPEFIMWQSLGEVSPEGLAKVCFFAVVDRGNRFARRGYPRGCAPNASRIAPADTATGLGIQCFMQHHTLQC